LLGHGGCPGGKISIREADLMEHREQADPVPEYEPPRVDVHGSLAATTGSFVAGIFTDKSLPAHSSIINNSSL
jgi:hypothetical protein